MIHVAKILPEFGSRSWYRLNQYPLLLLLNNPIPRVREYFRDNIICCDHLDPKYKIAKITGNSVHYQVDKDIRMGNFYSLDSNSNHIRKNFERILMPIHSWDMRIANRFFPAFNMGYDSITANSTTADGYVYAYGGAVWATVHDKSPGDWAYHTANDFWCMGARFQSPDIFIFRGFFYFDTSSMGSGKTVSAATMSFNNSCDDGKESNACVMKGTQSATLTTSDFQAFTGLYLGKTTSWNNTGYNDITLNDYTWINNNSACKISAREYDHDYSNVTCGTSSYRNGCWFAEKGAGYYPKLVITYTAGGGTATKPPFPFMRF
jgi:hypothetical protein